ncbi:MAG TPA: hypothetical protein VF665_14825 [Longimicrobium sp.]|jgi:hypothetical protein|uniref:hypothetical protein n=1 Tax=Longimicrobium sp. TaxID=2029185 RepID=UPI002ED9A126
MTRRFRGLTLALLLATPLAAHAQAPDAATLVQRMRERAAANVAGVRSYTLALTAGPTRTLAYVERTPKGGWVPRLQPGDPSPVRTLLSNTLDLSDLAGTEADDPDRPVPMGDVREDTAAGRRVYAVALRPAGGFGESGVTSVVAMVDAESYDLVRVVTTARGQVKMGAAGPDMVVRMDLLNYRERMGMRHPGGYHVQGWNVIPPMAPGTRAEMLRQMTAERERIAHDPAALWMFDIGARMLETGVMDLTVSVEVVAVDQPPPPEMKIRLRDAGR